MPSVRPFLSVRSTEPETIVPAAAPEDIPAAYANGLIVPDAYKAPNQPFYVEVGAGGSGGDVTSVTGGAGVTVFPTIGDVVVSLPNVGLPGATTNPASITTDAQGRVTAVTSLGYTPVAPSALSNYAQLTGATFSGPVQATTLTGTVSASAPTVTASTSMSAPAVTATSSLTAGAGAAVNLSGASTVTVPTPTLPTQAVTKAYADALVPSLAGYAQLAAPNTFTASNSFTGATSDFTVGASAAAPINEFQVWAGDVNLRSTNLTDVFNLTAAGAMSISTGAATTVNSGGLVNLTAAAGDVSIYSALGSVEIGGPINHITIGTDGQSISGVKGLTASGGVVSFAGATSVSASDFSASSVSTTSLTASGGAVNLTGATTVTVPTPTLPAQATTKLYVDNAISAASNVDQWATFPAVAPVEVPTEVDLQQPGNTSFKLAMSDIGTPSATFNAPNPIPFVSGSLTVTLPNNFMFLFNNIPLGPGPYDLPTYATVGLPAGTYTPATYITALNTAINAAIAQAYTLTSDPFWQNVKLVATISPTNYVTYTCYKVTSAYFAIWTEDYPISPPEPSGQTSAPLFGLQWNTTPVYFGELPQNVAVQYTRDGVAGTVETLLTTSSNPPTLAYNSGTKALSMTAENWNGDAVTLSTVSLAPALDAYVPLAGTAPTAPVTGTVAFEDGTGNIECADIATALISAVAPYDFISVTDPMQTKLLGVRSADGVNPATLLMAMSETAAPADTLSMRYEPAPGPDVLQLNKGISIAGGGNIDTATGQIAAQRIDAGIDGFHTVGVVDALGDITGALITANNGINTTTLTTNGDASVQGKLDVTLGDLTVSTGYNAINATVPTADDHLTNKLYVDSAVAAGGPFLPLAGGTMTGSIAMGGNMITGASAVETTGDITTTAGNIGTGSGDIGTLSGNIAADAGTVSGLQLVAGANGITSAGPLDMNPTLAAPQPISGVDSLTASGLIQGGSLLSTDTGNAVGSASIALKTDDPAFASELGTVASITFPDPTAQNAVLYVRGPISLVDPPNGGAPAGIIVNGVPWSSGTAWSASAATQNVDMAGYEIDNAGAVGATSVSTSDFITAGTTLTGADVVANTSLSVGGVNVGNTIAFKPSASLYVAKNGNDTTGNGSILQPYATIQKAYDIAKTLSSSANIYAINIGPGHYTENLNITGRTYVWFIGAVSQGILGGVGETTEIIGDITINANVPGGDDLYNKVTGFVNLQITGSITVSSSNESSLVVKDCKFFSQNRAIYVNPTATDYRTYLQNANIQHQSAGAFTDPLVEVTQGWLYANGGNWNAKNASSVLAISGTGSALQVSQVNMESANSSAALPAVVAITTTSTTPNTFGLCAMLATSATAKTTPAVLINSATPPAVNLLQNYFGISGTSAAGNVIQYAGTAPTLQIGANASQYSTAAAIQAGITAAPTQAVGTNSFGAVVCTSLTSTGAIAGASLAASGAVTAASGTIASTTMTGNTMTVTGTGQGVAAATVTNGATILNGRVNITGSSSTVALSVNSGTAANNTVELNGGTINTSGANGLKIAPAAISCVNNNVAMTGINSITMAGTTPSITGVNSMTITNTNGTVPFTINNNTDNPTMVMGISPASTTIPLEFQFNNNIISAFGNQNTSTRGSVFIYTNSKDCFRALSANARVLMNYSPYSPTLATSGAAGAFVAGTGAFVSGVPKLLGTETITLTSNNLPIIEGGFGTPCYIGLNGYMNTCVLNAAHDFVVTATYTRTRSGVTVGPYALYGCSYPITSQAGGAFYSPLNGTTYNEAVAGERITFTLGDVLAIQVYGTYTGGSAPTIVTPATGLAAVFSPFFI